MLVLAVVTAALLAGVPGVVQATDSAGVTDSPGVAWRIAKEVDGVHLLYALGLKAPYRVIADLYALCSPSPRFVMLTVSPVHPMPLRLWPARPRG